MFGSEIFDYDFAYNNTIAEVINAEGFADNTIGTDKSSKGGLVHSSSLPITWETSSRKMAIVLYSWSEATIFKTMVITVKLV